MISIKINDQEVRATLDRAAEFFSDERKDRLLNRLGELVSRRIEQRTAEGKDADGKPFEPYTAKYKLFRQKSGRAVNKVNLFFKGHMLNSITHRVEGRGDAVRIFFSTPQEARKAAENEQCRKFFAISADDVGAIYDEIDREIDRALK